MSEYTQGVCHDGAAILQDGQLLTIEQILEALRERDALAAHVERLIEAGSASDMCAFGITEEALAWADACEDAPTVSLDHRDILKQADGWDQAANVIEIMECPKCARFFREGVVNHLRYKAEKMRQQTEAH